MTIHTDEFCRRQREAALENFDLNMVFFAQIPQAAFEEALTEVLRASVKSSGSSACPSFCHRRCRTKFSLPFRARLNRPAAKPLMRGAIDDSLWAAIETE